MDERHKGESEMTEQMDFDRAWRDFYESRPNPPSEQDKEKVRQIIDHLGLSSFSVTRNYVRDGANRIHINSGFLVSREMCPHVGRDISYSEEGFHFRLWFSNRGGEPGSPETTVRGKVLCPVQGVRVTPNVSCDYCGESHPEPV